MDPNDGADARANEDQRVESATVHQAKTEYKQTPTSNETRDSERSAQPAAPATPTLLNVQLWFVRLKPETRQEIYNGTLAFATVASLGILGFQACQLNRTNQLATEAVNASLAANTQSRDAMRLERRAWVHATQFTLSAQPAYEPHEARVTISQENTGQTPAMAKVQLLISLAPLCAGFAEEDWNRPDLAWSPEIPLYPNAERPFTGSSVLTFTPEMVADYQNRRIHICVNARIAYRDTFGEYISDACRIHTAGNGLGQFAYCATGNRFDRISAANGQPPPTVIMETTTGPIEIPIYPNAK